MLKVAVFAWNSEIALLQATGLLPNSLGVLKVEQPTERIASGEELQRLFASINVKDADLVPAAERAWAYGDAAASEAAANDRGDHSD